MIETTMRVSGLRGGDLLAEIDPRPVKAQLTQAEGQLERDQAPAR
jgi:membrane fusion protein, multidrug efflux system